MFNVSDLSAYDGTHTHIYIYTHTQPQPSISSDCSAVLTTCHLYGQNQFQLMLIGIKYHIEHFYLRYQYVNPYNNTTKAFGGTEDKCSGGLV